MTQSNGILLIQLGSPENLSEKAIATYLKEFLGDPHTLGKSSFFWNLLLNGIIVPFGKKKSFQKYKRLFEIGNFSEMPLVSYSNVFLKKLRQEISTTPIEIGFQYGCKPSIQDALQRLTAQGCHSVLAVPLYPQRSDVTSGAAIEQVKNAAAQIQFKGSVAAANGFFARPAWAREMANSIRPFLEPSDTLVLSFHGVQQWRIDNGDPYEKDCIDGAQAIGNLLNTSPKVCYQSKYGTGKWLSPSLIQTLQELGQQKKNVVIASPAFTVDNLETIYEIDDEAQEIFKNAGGKIFKRVPCLNDSDSWVHSFAHEILPSLPLNEIVYQSPTES